MSNACKWTMSLALLAGSGFGSAALAQTVINFDDLSDSTTVSNQYAAQGVLFSGDPVIQAKYGSLNFTFYPPHSLNNVLAGERDATRASAVAGSTWSSAGAYVTGASITYLEAYDASDNLLGSDHTPGDNRDNWPDAVAKPNIFLSVAAANIAYVKIHDTGYYYKVDDFTFEASQVTPVPLPAAAWAGMAMLGGMAAARKARQRRASR